jgi:hypothetical protein
MQDRVMQLPVQPFIKLTQANVELLTRFSTSPEVISQSAEITQNLIQQTQQSAASLMQSSAFSELWQGMLKNYTEFLTEWNQSALTALVQAPAAMMTRAQEATDNVVDVAEARGRRSRRTA